MMGNDFDGMCAFYTQEGIDITLLKAAVLPEMWYVSQQTIKGQRSQETPGG